jgi:signal peptidase II
VVDQASKAAVRLLLPEGASIPLTSFLALSHVTNTGGAFGLFQGKTLFLIGASLVALLVLLLSYRHSHRSPPLTRLCLGLIVGGAIGNLVDRIRLGYVVDFIDLGWWPVFNIADSSIVAGITGLSLSYLVAQSRGHRRVVVQPLPRERFRRRPPEVGC